MSRPYKRKKVFVKKSLQSRYILYIVGTLALVSLASALCIYFGVWNATLNEFSNENIQRRLELSTRLREYQDARRNTLTVEAPALSMIKEVDLFSSRQREILDEILHETFREIYPFFFALLFFVGWGSIFMTHKIAGPIFRLEKSFEKLAKGEFDFRLHFRKRDAIKDIVPPFNEFIEKMNTSMGHLKQTSDRLETIAKTESLPVECLDLIAQLKHELAQYQTTPYEKGSENL